MAFNPIGRIRVNITGARGGLGIDLQETPTAGQFLVSAPGGGRKFLTSAGTGADAGLRTDLAGNAGYQHVGGVASDALNNLGAVAGVISKDGLTYPVANEVETYSQWSMTHAGLPSRSGKREFIYSVGVTFSYGGNGTNPYDEDKTLMYYAANVKGSVKQAWTMNTMLRLDESLSSIQYANVHEFDINNFSGKSYGATVGGLGLGTPSVYGVTVNGSSTGGNTITAGFGLISSVAGPLYERGYMVAPNSVVQAAFDDYSSGTSSYRDYGVHSFGIDLQGSYSLGGIRLPNGVSFVSNTTSGTLARLTNLDNNNNLRIGDPASIANVVSERPFIPNADNAFALGGPGNRWSTGYFAAGLIINSDPTLKKDFADISPAASGAFIDALHIQTGRWISGGKIPIKAKETQQVQVRTEMQTVLMRGKDGEPTEVEVSVPVYEDQEVDVVTGWEDRPGVRVHAWIMAPSVKEAAAAAGFDNFGGYVMAEDGIEGNRTDEIVAMMAAEMQALRARIAALEAGQK